MSGTQAEDQLGERDGRGVAIAKVCAPTFTYDMQCLLYLCNIETILPKTYPHSPFEYHFHVKMTYKLLFLKIRPIFRFETYNVLYERI